MSRALVLAHHELLTTVGQGAVTALGAVVVALRRVAHRRGRRRPQE